MVDVPAVIPVTIPVGPTLAFPVVELHTPPGSPVALLNAVVKVGHTVNDPVISPGTGDGLIVTTIATPQPPRVYEIVAVPALTPVTTPVPLTNALPVPGTELHTPPVVASVNAVVVVTHTVGVPVIGSGHRISSSAPIVGLTRASPSISVTRPVIGVPAFSPALASTTCRCRSVGATNVGDRLMEFRLPPKPAWIFASVVRATVRKPKLVPVV